MEKINWKRKLSSRKFWAAVIGFITPLLLSLGWSNETIGQIAAVIMSGATIISYIIAEGLVDSNNSEKGGEQE